MAKLKIVGGWTLLRSEADWHQWHKEQGAFYAEPAPCFPCFVQERLTSDEGTIYEYLTGGMLAVMIAAVQGGGIAMQGAEGLL